MKQNFSNEVIGKILVSLTQNINDITIRVNRAGNIDVRNVNTYNKEKWTLYNYSGTYVWRRTNLVNGYKYPLHMVNHMYERCGFITIKDALDYFIRYYKKHEFTYKYNRIWLSGSLMSSEGFYTD